MLFPDLQLARAYRIGQRIGLTRPRSLAVFAAYYGTTVLAALLDGLGMVVLVSLVTGQYANPSPDAVVTSVIEWLGSVGLTADPSVLLATAAILIAAKIVCNIAIDVADAALLAYTRLQMQRQELRGILESGWEALRGRRAGRMTAALIEETALACKYMTVAIRGGYFVVSATVLGLIALAVSAELTLLFAVLGLQVVLVLRRLFDAQTRLSREQTGVRQTLAADLAERLNNLFQIKVEGNEVSHHRMALKRAPEVARLEVKIGTGLSFIASANGLLLLVGLVGFYLWSAWRGAPLADAFALVASVGIVGYKAAAHANNALTTIGNLARLAGSIEPVYELIFLPPESARRPVPAKVTGVVLDGVSYSFNETRILDDASFSAGVGHPVAIRGPSGSGKTTAANLIAGLLTPSQGVVWYATEDGGRFDARQYKAHVGYVPQDISLFHGSFRDNIQFTAEPRTDAELMAILQQVDADEYVRQHGGLDATLLEGGRSLSGGERRRLGIARVLAQRPDILILDEVMNGLDEQRKSEVARIVQALSRRLVIIAITHDPEEYPGWREWQSAARPVLASGA